MQEIIQQIIGQKSADWIGKLEGLGFSGDQAKGFLPPLLEKVVGAVSNDGLDLSNLDPKAMLGKLDPAELAERAGIDADKSKAGLESLMPDVLSTIKDKMGDVSGIASKLGGLGGMFGK